MCMTPWSLWPSRVVERVLPGPWLQGGSNENPVPTYGKGLHDLLGFLFCFDNSSSCGYCDRSSLAFGAWSGTLPSRSDWDNVYPPNRRRGDRYCLCRWCSKRDVG